MELLRDSGKHTIQSKPGYRSALEHRVAINEISDDLLEAGESPEKMID
jgi:hypothetical protein